MRKVLLIALGVLLCSKITYSQMSEAKIGIKSGAGISQINPVFDSGLGLSNSVFFEYKLSNLLSAHVAMGHEQIQGRSDVILTDALGSPLGAVTLIDNFQYVNMPVLLKASFGDKVKYFINAGPSMSFLLNQKATAKNYKSITPANNLDDYNRFLIGASGGIGVELPISERLFLSGEIRSTWGLNTLRENNGNDWRTVNSLFLVGVSYAI